jgi:hypothetical protein
VGCKVLGGRVFPAVGRSVSADGPGVGAGVDWSAVGSSVLAFGVFVGWSVSDPDSAVGIPVGAPVGAGNVGAPVGSSVMVFTGDEVGGVALVGSLVAMFGEAVGTMTSVGWLVGAEVGSTVLGAAVGGIWARHTS